jgi:hypothetical protein
VVLMREVLKMKNIQAVTSQTCEKSAQRCDGERTFSYNLFSFLVAKLYSPTHSYW